jgi:hypothetical protein
MDDIDPKIGAAGINTISLAPFYQSSFPIELFEGRFREISFGKVL